MRHPESAWVRDRLTHRYSPTTDLGPGGIEVTKTPGLLGVRTSNTGPCVYLSPRRPQPADGDHPREGDTAQKPVPWSPAQQMTSQRAQSYPDEAGNAAYGCDGSGGATVGRTPPRLRWARDQCLPRPGDGRGNPGASIAIVAVIAESTAAAELYGLVSLVMIKYDLTEAENLGLRQVID